MEGLAARQIGRYTDRGYADWYSDLSPAMPSVVSKRARSVVRHPAKGIATRREGSSRSGNL